MRDAPDPYRLRQHVARREPWRDLAQLSNGELVQEWLNRAEQDEDLWGEAWFMRAALGGAASGEQREPAAEPTSEPLAPTYFIAFELQDGVGDPYPGLDYVLEGPETEREEGKLPASAQVRRDDVQDDDYRLTLKTVDELAWGGTAALCGQEVALVGIVGGHADGTAAEIRVFRELRETDDDVVDTIDASVEGGRVVASWTYDVGASHAIKGSHPQLRFIAELRVPGATGWVKTPVPLVLELPSIRAVRWSRRGTAPGKPVEIRVGIAGIADGSPVTVEVFKQRRDGSQECLDTFEGLPVTEGGIVLSWTYEADASDPNAPNEAEVFFVATSEEFLDATRTSGPLWISRAVGRKTKKRKGQRGRERDAATSPAPET